MVVGAWGHGVMLLLSLLGLVWAEEKGICGKVPAVEAILECRDSCAASDPGVAGVASFPVLEGDEVALQMALNLVHRNRKEYVALLFHASWCPFSKICRPNFDVMASMFSTVRHFAFEESVIKPSILSRYGVHGFPTLFLLNSTMRVRYHGSRSINSLVTFYNDVTGFSPSLRMYSEKIEDPAALDELIEDGEKENCPFSWARSPEKLLQQDSYLALAIAFVLWRLLYCLFPKLSSCVVRAWRRRIRHASLIGMWDYFHACFLQAKQSLSRLNPCKRSDFQEGAMHAKVWASKSLASVSIGEPSSVRSQ